MCPITDDQLREAAARIADSYPDALMSLALRGAATAALDADERHAYVLTMLSDIRTEIAHLRDALAAIVGEDLVRDAQEVLAASRPKRYPSPERGETVFPATEIFLREIRALRAARESGRL